MARRVRRWAVAGVWETVLLAVQEPDYEWVLVDSTTVKAHKAAAGKKSIARFECLGRSRGGFGTKVHAIVDALDHCLHLALTPAESADSSQLPRLLAALAYPPGAVVCDKASDTNHVLNAITAQQAIAVIPPKSTRLHQRPYERNLYADRNKIERFFGRLKEA